MKCSAPLKCQKTKNKKQKTHSFVTCLPRLMLRSTQLLFDFLTTLTCQFPLLLEMLMGRWTLRLIIYSSSPLAIISCFFFCFFLLHSWSLQTTPPPPVCCPLSPFMFFCLCISISFTQPLLFCLIFFYASPFNCLIVLFCFYLCRRMRPSVFSCCFSARLSFVPCLLLP